MKKLLVILSFLFVFSSFVFAEEDTQGPCGNSYMFNYDNGEQITVYLIKFNSSNPDLPCTSGTATVYWANQKISYPFTLKNLTFANVTGLGKFALYSSKLYFLDTTSIVFTEY